MTKPGSWQIVEEPLRALADVVDQLPAVMLVGAVCRDVLHEEHGHKGALRRTDDVDLALAVNGWDEFEDLTARLEDVRDSAGSVRYLIGGCRVDLVPFGQGIETPDGVLALPPSGHGMSVYGFQDVFDESREIDLGAAAGSSCPWGARQASMSRTSGATCVPYSSIERVSMECGMLPLAYLRSKRLAPRPSRVRAILRATVSGLPMA